MTVIYLFHCVEYRYTKKNYEQIFLHRNILFFRKTKNKTRTDK